MRTVLWLFLATLLAGAAYAQGNAPRDSLPPAFQSDSTKFQTIRNLEAGKTGADTGKARAVTARYADSLNQKLHHRHPFLGATISFAFSDLSARNLFATHFQNVTANDTPGIVQTQDPVTVFFPVGLTAAYPLLPYLDVWLRTESFWYGVSGLSEDKTLNTHEYGYDVLGNVIGVGARYLIPVSLLSVNGHPGLYVSYTQFWNAGQSALYNGNGTLYAKMDPAGVGYEIQSGFQQDFDKRWAWTGGIAFTNLGFKSNSNWRNILSDGPDEKASWTLRSLRLCILGFYQFGISSPEKGK